MGTPSAHWNWNSELYQSSHSFVWQHGRDLLALLEPKPGERILDLGCGTGQLIAEVARAGPSVVGVDASPDMIAAARRNFPDLCFDFADAAMLPYTSEFDAVISNAALHWVRDQPAAIASVARALKPTGRFVFEMGGYRNLQEILNSICRALASLGVTDGESRIPWYFPSIGQYAPLLESQGLEVRLALLFDRPTVLEKNELGLASWIEMFCSFAFSAVLAEQHAELIRRVEELARPALFRDGVWTIDYVRLRMLAVKN